MSLTLSFFIVYVYKYEFIFQQHKFQLFEELIIHKS